MSKSLGPEDIQKLLAAPTYQEFIQLMMAIKSRRGRTFTYAELSRKVGLKSRSYIRDIVVGSKKLPLNLIPKLSRALDLNQDLSRVLSLLVQKEMGELTEQATKDLKKIRKRMLFTLTTDVKDGISFALPEIPIVYASLGEKDVGATLKDIEKRTGLSQEFILKVLQILIQLKLALPKNDRFLPVEEHVAFDNLKKSDLFKNHFHHLLEKAHTRARINFHSDTELFFGSSFSVKSERLPELKASLHQVLLQYVDTNEDSKGDKVVSMVCSLF